MDVDSNSTIITPQKRSKKRRSSSTAVLPRNIASPLESWSSSRDRWKVTSDDERLKIHLWDSHLLLTRNSLNFIVRMSASVNHSPSISEVSSVIFSLILRPRLTNLSCGGMGPIKLIHSPVQKIHPRWYINVIPGWVSVKTCTCTLKQSKWRSIYHCTWGIQRANLFEHALVSSNPVRIVPKLFKHSKQIFALALVFPLVVPWIIELIGTIGSFFENPP